MIPFVCVGACGYPASLEVKHRNEDSQAARAAAMAGRPSAEVVAPLGSCCPGSATHSWACASKLTKVCVKRCQNHKRRKVLKHLPEHMPTSMRRALKLAWSASDANLAPSSSLFPSPIVNMPWQMPSTGTPSPHSAAGARSSCSSQGLAWLPQRMMLFGCEVADVPVRLPPPRQPGGHGDAGSGGSSLPNLNWQPRQCPSCAWGAAAGGPGCGGPDSAPAESAALRGQQF